MVHLPDPVETGLSPEQRRLYDQLAAKRGRIDGMYRSLLHHPDLLERVAALGTFFRFGGSVLPDQARELAILATARRLGAAYEWVKHIPPAREAGLSEETLEALRQGGTPRGLAPGLQAAYDAAQCVYELKALPAALQDALEQAYGIKGVVELVALCGFYRMIAGVVFAFDVPLPEGERDPF